MAAEGMVYGILRAVYNQASSLALREYNLLCAAQEEVEKLKITVSLLQSFLSDAEKRQHGEDLVKIWIQNLQDVSYDAEDILDELNSEALRLKVNRAQTSWIMLVGDFLLSCFTCSDHVPILFSYQIARRIKVVRGRLDFIVSEGRNLGFHESFVRQSQHAGKESSPLVLDSEVVGRSKEKETLLELLVPSISTEASETVPSPLNFEVISIFGMGGLGKTTLARAVYNDGKVKKYFKPTIWASVTGNPSATRLISQIIESVLKRKPKVTTLEELQTSLGKLLQGRRFLLVLDDVWSERTVWNALRIPLSSGRIGSRVVITSRNQASALPSDIQTTSIKLEPLSFENCWSIFQRYTNVEGSALEMVGRDIVKKARGVPLVAKSLGCLAKSFGLNRHRWTSILKDEVPQHLDDEMDIISILRLSYDHLPSSLKQCFAFCAIFPKGYAFDKAVVVNMWMALGFVQAQGGQRMEDVGSDYFNDLLRRSFFDHSHSGQYKMHDFIHSLAQSVSGDECLISIPGSDLVADPCKVRHLSLTDIDSQMLKNVQKFSKLRSVVFLKQDESLSVRYLGHLFKKLKCLRVLDLSCVTKLSDSDTFLGALRCYFNRDYSKEFPMSVGSLKLLRYLHLSINDVKKLPGSLGNLHNLQILSLRNCKKHFRLPREMAGLVNLRNFYVDAFEEDYQISAIGNLTALQELKKFRIGRDDKNKIGELKHLNDLRKLSISNMENVISIEEAREARIADKPYLDSLELEWTAEATKNELHEEVLNNLKPNMYVRELVIRKYGGVRSPSWLQNLSLPFLESVHLLGCQWWKVLPPLGQLQFLKVLELSGMDGGRSEGCFEFFDDDNFNGVWFPQLRWLRIRSSLELLNFPNLPPTLTEMQIETLGFSAVMTSSRMEFHTSSAPHKTLSIFQSKDLNLNWENLLQHHLWALKELSISNCRKLVSVSLKEFSSLTLKKLSINNCPVLHRLPPLPSTLQELRLDKVGLSNLPEVCEVSISTTTERRNEVPLPSSSPFRSYLEISECHSLISLCDGLLNQKLKELVIYDCRHLQALPLRGLKSLVNLKKLDISVCPELEELPPLPLGLIYLGLDSLGLRALPTFIECTSYSPSLKKLEISNCPELGSLCNGLLEQDVRALEELFIIQCEKLELLPGLGPLASLRVLTIVNCPKLVFVLEDMQPFSQTRLEIEGCPLLMEQFQAEWSNFRPEIFSPQLTSINGRWHRQLRDKRTYEDKEHSIKFAKRMKRQPTERSRRTRVLEMVIRDTFPCCFRGL